MKRNQMIGCGIFTHFLGRPRGRFSPVASAFCKGKKKHNVFYTSALFNNHGNKELLSCNTTHKYFSSVAPSFLPSPQRKEVPVMFFSATSKPTRPGDTSLHPALVCATDRGTRQGWDLLNYNNIISNLAWVAAISHHLMVLRLICSLFQA